LGGGYDFGKNASGFSGDQIKVSGLQVGVRHSFLMVVGIAPIWRGAGVGQADHRITNAEFSAISP
jgi:hypothetical protein